MASMIAWSPALAEAAPPGRSMTLDEWLALAEDESGEWVAGHLLEEEMTDPIHELAVTGSSRSCAHGWAPKDSCSGPK